MQVSEWVRLYFICSSSGYNFKNVWWHFGQKNRGRKKWFWIALSLVWICQYKQSLLLKSNRGHEGCLRLSCSWNFSASGCDSNWVSYRKWQRFEISSAASSLTSSHQIHSQTGGTTQTKSNSAFGLKCTHFCSARICIASFCRPGCCLPNGLKSGTSTETLVSVWLLMPWNFDAKMQLGSRERITLLWKRRLIAAGKQMSMCQPSGEVGQNATHPLPRDKETQFNLTKVVFTLFFSPQ